MDFRSIWLSMKKQARQQLAEAAGSKYGYLQKLAGGYGMPSIDFVKKLEHGLHTLGIDASLDIDGFVRARQEAGQRLVLASKRERQP
jgi:transcriptional regulator with XRE-family HTH domain